MEQIYKGVDKADFCNQCVYNGHECRFPGSIAFCTHKDEESKDCFFCHGKEEIVFTFFNSGRTVGNPNCYGARFNFCPFCGRELKR